MESEKVKEIKNWLEEESEVYRNEIAYNTLDLINELESENERLEETVKDMSGIIKVHKYCVGADHCQNSSAREFELKDQIAELEGEITKLDIINSKLEMDIELLNKQNIDLEIDRDYYQEQFNEQEDFYVEWNKQQLKQFAEMLKEKFYYEGRICRYIIDSDVFDETLKEFIK
jgi:hypothetical protein